MRFVVVSEDLLVFSFGHAGGDDGGKFGGEVEKRRGWGRGESFCLVVWAGGRVWSGI